MRLGYRLGHSLHPGGHPLPSLFWLIESRELLILVTFERLHIPLTLSSPHYLQKTPLPRTTQLSSKTSTGEVWEWTGVDSLEQDSRPETGQTRSRARLESQNDGLRKVRMMD